MAAPMQADGRPVMLDRNWQPEVIYAHLECTTEAEGRREAEKYAEAQGDTDG